MVETMWVGARTFPLLIATFRSSGTVGGTVSLTGTMTFFATCKSYIFASNGLQSITNLYKVKRKVPTIPKRDKSY